MVVVIVTEWSMHYDDRHSQGVTLSQTHGR